MVYVVGSPRSDMLPGMQSPPHSPAQLDENFRLILVRRMKPLTRFLLLGVAVLVIFTSCGKSTAKFQPGDNVVVRLNPDTKGIVYLRFNTDEPYYYLKVAGAAGNEMFVTPTFFNDSWKGLKLHIEGPFYDSDLELAPQ
jgi:hypothetical protein